MILGLGLLAVAAVVLVAGAELFVENAAGAARKLGLTVLAVGLLLAGAEPEELLTAVIAAAQHHPNLAAGDALGANVTMLTVTLGLAALLRPLPVGHRVRTYAAISTVAGVLALLAVAGGRLTRPEGGLLVVAYVALVAAVWWREREPPALGELAEVEEEETHPSAPAREEAEPPAAHSGRRRPGAALLLLLLGIGLMVLGGNVAVAGATRLVDALGISESAVGLSLVALATTAELFALVLAAARHDVSELAVAGVVGSAAYNATATLGAAALVRPLGLTGMTWPAALGAALPLVVVALSWRGRLTRPTGALLCAGYAGYLWMVLR